MKRQFRDLALFVEVAKQRNFSRAANMLRMPVSTLSRRVQALEQDLGTALFLRSARSVELTDSGSRFFERCSVILAEAESAWEEVSQSMQQPSGPVRVSLPGEIYHDYLVETLNEFSARWPGIQLHITLSHRWVGLHAEPFDLDLRIGPLPDSSLKVRRLITLRPALYASPALLERYPAPRKPADLATLPCISLFVLGSVWTLRRDKESVSVGITPAHMVNSPSVSSELALAGLGVALQMPAAVVRHVKSGGLVRLLPEWRHSSADLNMVLPNARVPQRVRLFMDHLADYFARLPV